MKLTANEVYVLILSDGTELVTRCVNNDDSSGFATFERPLRAMPIPVPQQGPRGLVMAVTMQLVPAFPHTGQREFGIRLSHLLCAPIQAPKDLENAWLQMTSGIQIAS